MTKNRIRKIIVTVIFLPLFLAMSSSLVRADEGRQLHRISGMDRYETAYSVAIRNWTTSENVVLVSGEGYADTVNASVLAKKLDAPIILTTQDILSSNTQMALNILRTKNIYIIGGNASVSQGIRDKLKAKYNLIELGGDTRYETNLKVANELIKLGTSAEDILVVGGEGFSDALSIAPIAAIKGKILLLVNNNSVSIQPIIDFVKNNNSKVTVVGTKNVISDDIFKVLGGTTRIDGGANRFDTNLKILDTFKSELNFNKIYISSATPSEPDNMYADALVAAALAGKYSSPLVLVDKEPSSDLRDSNATDNAINYIENNAIPTSELLLIGGESVISQTTEDEIYKYIIPRAY
ncbi:cell wall-binding repeat-containing protein [Clostridium scatologenes]|uniref:Cell wall-binding protein n=1 Tax=Clostridium scatologenes TaxID=1548 RepID=A0A0E3M908_CLOSL|nr:cell wall-binding repeat-containing protein [Clostridium scatologenes]AKA72378.1 cell wall-binding protein [Clostridium scatologenes]